MIDFSTHLSSTIRINPSTLCSLVNNLVRLEIIPFLLTCICLDSEEKNLCNFF